MIEMIVEKNVCNAPKFLSLTIFVAVIGLSVLGDVNCAADDDLDLSQSSNPGALNLFTQAFYSRFSNFTLIFKDDISRELGFCIQDV